MPAQSIASSAKPSAADLNAATHHQGRPRAFASPSQASDTRCADFAVFCAATTEWSDW
ncbi:hypothetical protein [Amycolatopsis sp. NPDC059021]|uniref:hypothetical protein n=1 Tax=Amycolatopsis sp. NPDC059021 TaxID=3346704 RepID=UPI00366CF7C6